MPVWATFAKQLGGAALGSALGKYGKLVRAAAAGQKAALRRAAVRAIMPRVVQHGWSVARTIREFRKYGLGMRTQTFYRLARPSRMVRIAVETAKSMALGEPIRVGKLPRFGNPPRGYHQAVIRYRVIDPLSGRPSDRYFTMLYRAGERPRDLLQRTRDAMVEIAETAEGRGAYRGIETAEVVDIVALWR